MKMSIGDYVSHVKEEKKVMQYINTVVFWHDIPSDNPHALAKYTTKTHTEKILKTDLLLFY